MCCNTHDDTMYAYSCAGNEQAAIVLPLEMHGTFPFPAHKKKGSLADASMYILSGRGGGMCGGHVYKKKKIHIYIYEIVGVECRF